MHIKQLSTHDISEFTHSVYRKFTINKDKIQ